MSSHHSQPLDARTLNAKEAGLLYIAADEYSPIGDDNVARLPLSRVIAIAGSDWREKLGKIRLDTDAAPGTEREGHDHIIEMDASILLSIASTPASKKKSR